MGGGLLIVAVALGAPALKEPKPHPLVGTWLILERTQDGQTADVRGDHCWTFTADGRRAGHTLRTRPTYWLRYEMDEKARPPAVTVTGVSFVGSPAESYDFLFKIDGDTLTVCTRERGRPASIGAEAGSGNLVYKLRRVKAKD